MARRWNNARSQRQAAGLNSQANQNVGLSYMANKAKNKGGAMWQAGGLDDLVKPQQQGMGFQGLYNKYDDLGQKQQSQFLLQHPKFAQNLPGVQNQMPQGGVGGGALPGSGFTMPTIPVGGLPSVPQPGIKSPGPPIDKTQFGGLQPPGPPIAPQTPGGQLGNPNPATPPVAAPFTPQAPQIEDLGANYVDELIQQGIKPNTPEWNAAMKGVTQRNPGENWTRSVGGPVQTGVDPWGRPTYAKDDPWLRQQYLANGVADPNNANMYYESGMGSYVGTLPGEATIQGTNTPMGYGSQGMAHDPVYQNGQIPPDLAAFRAAQQAGGGAAQAFLAANPTFAQKWADGAFQNIESAGYTNSPTAPSQPGYIPAEPEAQWGMYQAQPVAPVIPPYQAPPPVQQPQTAPPPQTQAQTWGQAPQQAGWGQPQQQQQKQGWWNDGIKGNKPNGQGGQGQGGQNQGQQNAPVTFQDLQQRYQQILANGGTGDKFLAKHPHLAGRLAQGGQAAASLVEEAIGADPKTLALPLSPEFEAGRRALDDQLSAELANIAGSRAEIPAMLDFIKARLATDEAMTLRGVRESMSDRGMLDSSVTTRNLGEASLGFDRSRQDLGMDAARQLKELARAESGAQSGYGRGLAELLMEVARNQAQDPRTAVRQDVSVKKRSDAKKPVKKTNRRRNRNKRGGKR